MSVSRGQMHSQCVPRQFILYQLGGFFSDFAVLPLVFCPSWVASFLSLSFPNN